MNFKLQVDTRRHFQKLKSTNKQVETSISKMPQKIPTSQLLTANAYGRQLD